jgi:hypothetical protein
VIPRRPQQLRMIPIPATYSSNNARRVENRVTAKKIFTSIL